MTARPADVAVASFGDAADAGYNIMVIADTAEHQFLKESKEGSDMHEYYYSKMNGNPAAFSHTQE